MSQTLGNVPEPDAAGSRIRKGVRHGCSRTSTNDTENAKKCGETAFSERRSLIQKQLLQGTPGEEEKRREGDKTEVL